MTSAYRIPKHVFAALLAATLGAIVVVGCTTQPRPATSSGNPAAPATQASTAPQKGRAQIWAESCARCHTMRGPDWYSDGEWEVAMQHMRIRGYLIGQEHKAIEEFLKAGN